jgi:phosphopantetheinyl transferase
MTEHLTLYNLAGRIPFLESEMERSRIPEYRKENMRKQFKLMKGEVRWLLDQHDKTECARCAKLKAGG